MRRGQFGSIICVVCLLALLCTSCGETVPTTVPSKAKAPAAAQIYRWSFGLPDINSLDPGVATDSASLQAINLVFTGLVQLDDQLQIRPQLAQSYAVSDAGLTYTFHLRPDLTFSDGMRLDANDVAYSIDRALSPAINDQSGVALTYLGLIKGAEARTKGTLNSIIGSGVIVQDPATVVLKLRLATAYFLGALSYPTSFVVERSVIDRWHDRWTDHLNDNGGQGGAGPFVVSAYDHTTGIKLLVNTHYYSQRPQLHEIDYVPYKDVDTSYNAYLAGQTDVTGIPLTLYNQAKTRPDFSMNSALSIFYVGMNYLVRPLDNISIRQAFAVALSRDTVVKGAWHNAFTPSCHIIPSGMYGYNEHLTCPLGTTTRGDPAKAKQLFKKGLQEEGLTVKTFPQITLTYPSQSPEVANEAAIEVQIWQSVLGVTIATTTMSQNSLYTAAAQTWKHDGPLQMWLAGWEADFPDPQDWITLQFGENQSNNAYNFGQNHSSAASEQQDLQRQMLVADTLMDVAARANAYHKIEQQLVDQVAWLSLYQRPNMRLLKPYVRGFTFNAASLMPPDNWAHVYISKH